MSVLTNDRIKTLIGTGEIVMLPQDLSRVNNGSVDVSLGRFVLRVKNRFRRRGNKIRVNDMKAEDVFDLEDLKATNGVLMLDPGERVLAHTHEFIGGRTHTLPEMRAKSTMARWGLTVCACAGWGDVGYFNRWTMEIKNLNECEVEIDMGTLVAQIVFHDVGAPEKGTVYNQPGAGSYQQGDDLEALTREWRPSMMAPKEMKVIEQKTICHFDGSLVVRR